MKKKGRRRITILRFLLLLAMSDFFHFNEAHPIYIHSTPEPLNTYQRARQRPLTPLFLDIGDLSHFRSVSDCREIAEEGRKEKCINVPDSSNWEDDNVEIDATPLSSAGIDRVISHQLIEQKRQLPFEKRGGKGMSRHLFAAATAATLAMGTASMGIFANSLKAYDQDKCGVSRKTGLQDKAKDGKKDSNDSKSKGENSKGADKKNESRNDDNEPKSPESPTFINRITYVNNITINPGQIRRDIERREGCRDTALKSSDDPQLNKRDLSAPPKGWKKYDKHAPFLEKVEDYGKMAAATGAFAAAIVASYSAVKAHEAYHEKELKAKQEEQSDDDDDKHKRSSKQEDDDNRSENIGLMPSIIPCSSMYG